MKKIFDHVGLNTRGEIIYLPVKVAITTGGRIFFEVNPDAYYKIGDLLKEAQRIAKLYNITEQIDWDKSNRLIKEKTGIAEDVTREQVAINDKL